MNSLDDWTRSLQSVDPWLTAVIRREELRQSQQICLAAASSLCSSAILEAQGSVFSNIDAEGYPHVHIQRKRRQDLVDVDEQVAFYKRHGDARYGKGAELVNVVEVMAQKRAAAAFATEWADHSDVEVLDSEIYANVQCATGAIANTAVCSALLKPGDTILSMSLSHGGHLSHGSALHTSGKLYQIVAYGVDPATEQIDYQQIQDLALKYKPRLIIGGASSYPWAFEWKKLRQIAQEVSPSPYILADISHPAGLIVAGVIPNPIGYADVVTFTTYKTLCGPRGAAILWTDPALSEAINRSVFPGIQSSPIFQQIVALAVAFQVARTEPFKGLQRKIAENARLLASHLEQQDIPIAFGGTNTHIVVANVRKLATSSGNPLYGAVVAQILEKIGITCNSNLVPGDKNVSLASGIRLGTTWLSQLGYAENDIGEVAAIIARVCKGIRLFDSLNSRKKVPQGKIRAEVFLSERQHVMDILARTQTSRRFSLVSLEENDRHVRCIHLQDGDIWDLTHATGVLLVRGEHARNFLQQILTADLYLLNAGNVLSAQAWYVPRQTWFQVLVCAIPVAAQHHSHYLLVYEAAAAPHFADWLCLLSDGWGEIEHDDLELVLDGPVVIKGAAIWQTGTDQPMGEVLLPGSQAQKLFLNLCGGRIDPSLSVQVITYRQEECYGIAIEGDNTEIAWKLIGSYPALSELIGFLSTEASDPAQKIPARDDSDYFRQHILKYAHANRGSFSREENPSVARKPYLVGYTVPSQIEHVDKAAFSFDEIASDAERAQPSPISHLHKKRGAVFLTSGPWKMPAVYTSVDAEYEAMQRSVGLLDLSDTMLLAFEGEGAARFLDLVLTERISHLDPGDSCYTFLLSPYGRVLTDCTLYCVETDFFLMKSSSDRSSAIEAWLKAVTERTAILDFSQSTKEIDATCSIQNLKDASRCISPYGILALQGPSSENVLQQLMRTENHCHNPIAYLRQHSILRTSLAERECYLTRTNSPGEHARYAMFVPLAAMGDLWETLLNIGCEYALCPVGLEAMERLRIETGLPRYGRELAGVADINPLEAGYEIRFDKPFFVGRSAIHAHPRKRTLIRFCTEETRDGLLQLQQVFQEQPLTLAGVVTSYTYVRDRYYGLALLDQKRPAEKKLRLSCGPSITLDAEILPRHI
jgi:glycine/serine hydroxymethyltransferase/glycine cleavage system aminomethyltransferase T